MKYVLNNSQNLNHVNIYGRGAVYDFDAERDGQRFDHLTSDDIAIVLSYAVNGRDIKVLTYSVDSVETDMVTGVIRGRLINKEIISKREAARSFPEMFDCNDNFLRILIAEHKG